MIDCAALIAKRDEAERQALAATDEREKDRCVGALFALNQLVDQHCRFPVAPGTVMHGIDVSRLHWLTRAKVMAGNLATIYALRGKPDRKG